MNRQRLILFILLIIMALAMVWSYLNWPRQQTIGSLKYPPGSHLVAEKRREPAQAAKNARPADGVLRLDLLNQEQPPFKGYRRDIFRPIFVDELRQMKQQAAIQKPALPPPPPPKTGPPVVVPPVAMPEPPHRELARFTFLGFLKKGNQKTIFLTKDKDIVLVKKGDILPGGYEAASITDQALTILVIDTGEEIVIPLLENRPLTAAK
jgi:hypothetical protein